MRFTFQSRPTEDASAGQPAAFRVGRLWRHEGRRATEVSLPPLAPQESARAIVAPAEVEIP